MSCQETHWNLIGLRGEKEQTSRVRIDVLLDLYLIGLYPSSTDCVKFGTSTERTPYIVELNLSLTDVISSESKSKRTYVLQEVYK